MLTHRAMLRASASAFADRPALIGDDRTSLTYRELDQITEACAAGLRNAGLEPGDRVAWLAQNCLEYLVAYFATAKAALVFAPINFWLRPAEIDRVIDRVRPQAVIADAHNAERLESASAAGEWTLRVLLDGHRSGWESWSDLLTRSGSGAGGGHDENALHEIIFTSGTTGQVKGVMRSQRQRIIDSLTSAMGFQVRRTDHQIFFGPQFHVGGASVPNQVLVQGGVASVITFSPERVAEAIAEGATYMIGVPAHYNLMFEAGALDGVDTSRVNGCYVGGSVATRTLFDAIGKRFPGADMVHGYGSTESGPHTLSLRGKEFVERPGALGLPVPGTQVRVIDSAGADIGPDRPHEIGELVVRSDSVMLGYLDDPELTATVLDAAGWLRTGDLVHRDEDGYFYLAGRAKEMIISGGENVYPKEVEDVMSTHGAVAEVAVVGAPDAVYEERVVAYVRLHRDMTASDEELKRHVRDRIAGYKTPKEVHLVDDFPRTALGKIAKTELGRPQGGAQ